ncbi:MAG: hypothetical protein OER92_12040, partial [Alphaproteobacteria bacterium]|nr:hypothetical protein [Alphaproteobacteria bacterium]
MEGLMERTKVIWQEAITLLGSPQFYAQIAIIVVALILAWALAAYCKARVKVFREAPQPGALYEMRARLHSIRELLVPVMAAVVLGIATPLSAALIGAD